MKLQPIIRNVSTDNNDANNFVQEPEYTLYVKYLYRNKKPVYRLTCMYENILNDAVKDFLDGEPDLADIVKTMKRKVRKPWDFESVIVDSLE